MFLGEVLGKVLPSLGLDYEISESIIIIKPTKAGKILNYEMEQQKKIEVKGKIRDADGIPLLGATIIEEGTTNGVTSDKDGYFNLSVTSKESILKISYIGFIPQSFKVGNQLEFDIILEYTANKLDEFVVVGYGTAKKESVGSSISQIKGEDIEAKSLGSTNFEQIIGGQIKGVQITQSSGAPGAAAVVRIRGITSPFSSGNNQPLYVIDGVPFNIDAQFDVGGAFSGKISNPLLSIDPNEIESLTVLKDAGATAIYGSRGANGVILIETKRGEKNSEIRTTVQYGLSLSNPIKKMDLLDADGFKELHTMIARNTLNAYLDGSASNSGYQQAYQIIDPSTNQLRESVYDLMTGKNIPVFGSANTNWQDEVYRKNAPIQKWNVNVSGGDRRTNFSLDLTYIDQDPLFINSSYKSYGVKLRIDSDVKEWLRVGSSLNYSGSRDFSPNKSTNTYEILQSPPNYAIYNEDGSYQTIPFYWINIAPGMGMLYIKSANPVAMLENEILTNSTSFIGNAFAEATIFKGFKIRADANTMVFITRGRNFSPIRSGYDAPGVYNTLTNSIAENINTSLNLQASYHKQINKNYIDAMVGTSYDKATYYRNHVKYSNLSDDYVLTNASSANTVLGSLEGKAYSGINSIYSRLQYSYDGIYTATINFRADKSSKFGPNNKLAYFPSLAVNWNIDREQFMSNLKFIDKLILRNSYGKSGQANVEDFTYLQFFEAGSGIDKEYEVGRSTIVPNSTFPNTDIRWESTKEFNIGLDFSLLSNSLYGSLDIYNKQTEGILVPSPFPRETGASKFTRNLADVSNKGWEFEIGSDIIHNKDIDLSIAFNISSNHNKVENMEGHALSSSQTNYFTEGQPVGTIKGYRVERIIQTQEEIDALNNASPTGLYYHLTTGPGDYLYKDINGDGIINANDKVVIGSIQPDYFGGFNTSFRYKRISLNASFQYSVGSEAIWLMNDYLLNVNSTRYNGITEALTDTWTPDNTDAKYARLIYDNDNNGSVVYGEINDAILQDASYLRLKIVRVSYDIPKNILDKLSIGNASISISATNLFTFSSFKGIDPEAASMSITGSVLNVDQYPYSKTISFGVKIGL
jgi:TonB-linked SusC/RagA family outer membrane protein